MSIYKTDYAELFNDGQYFAQIPFSARKIQQTPSGGSIAEEVLAVVTDLVDGAYELGTVAMPFEPAKDLEVYDALTQILPVLSEQSVFFWKSVARTLASMLATAKYPIRAQASHLVFWWARLGGLMGVTSLAARVGEHENSSTTDGSNVELSWAIPSHTAPSEDSNRKVRFAIDPVHPERGHRLAGGAVLDYLWSAEGSLRLVKNDPGSKEWKDIIEKWLYPDIKNSAEFVEGSLYQIAFGLEPSGEINLKMYYSPPGLPPSGETPKNRVASHGSTDDLEPFQRLAKDLHPSLGAPLKMFVDFVHGDGKGAKMKWMIVACDVTSSEKNRLKVYVVSERTKLEDMVYDMTLGGRITGPHIEDAVVNFSKFFNHLFKSSTSSKESEIVIKNSNINEEAVLVNRGDLHTFYYYEFFIDEPVPYCKASFNLAVYFMMYHFSDNDYKTAQATESFFRDVGKPGEEGWMAKAVAHAYPHRALDKRNGIHTAVSFGTKPAGWEVTNYYSPELFSPERRLL